ncbi:hypothetical protein PINS_up000995 [Pythium insidiosum]|nr:hypothetical protein PINS_up000995 [Pythium insidiosum]
METKPLGKKATAKQKAKQLIDAAERGDLQRVTSLLDEGVDVHARDQRNGRTALVAAAWNGRYDVVRLLVRRGGESSFKEDETRAFVAAAWNGHLEVVRFLFDRGIDAREKYANGRTVLHAAVWNGHHDVVLLLLDRGVDANVRDNRGRTILHDGSLRGHTAIVRLLLCGTVDAEERDNVRQPVQ